MGLEIESQGLQRIKALKREIADKVSLKLLEEGVDVLPRDPITRMVVIRVWGFLWGERRRYRAGIYPADFWTWFRVSLPDRIGTWLTNESPDWIRSRLPGNYNDVYADITIIYPGLRTMSPNRELYFHIWEEADVFSAATGTFSSLERLDDPVAHSYRAVRLEKVPFRAGIPVYPPLLESKNGREAIKEEVSYIIDGVIGKEASYPSRLTVRDVPQSFKDYLKIRIWDSRLWEKLPGAVRRRKYKLWRYLKPNYETLDVSLWEAMDWFRPSLEEEDYRYIVKAEDGRTISGPFKRERM